MTQCSRKIVSHRIFYFIISTAINFGYNSAFNRISKHTMQQYKEHEQIVFKCNVPLVNAVSFEWTKSMNLCYPVAGNNSDKNNVLPYNILSFNGINTSRVIEQNLKYYKICRDDINSDFSVSSTSIVPTKQSIHFPIGKVCNSNVIYKYNGSTAKTKRCFIQLCYDNKDQANAVQPIINMHLNVEMCSEQLVKHFQFDGHKTMNQTDFNKISITVSTTVFYYLSITTIWFNCIDQNERIRIFKANKKILSNLRCKNEHCYWINEHDDGLINKMFEDSSIWQISSIIFQIEHTYTDTHFTDMIPSCNLNLPLSQSHINPENLLQSEHNLKTIGVDVNISLDRIPENLFITELFYQDSNCSVNSRGNMPKEVLSSIVAYSNSLPVVAKLSSNTSIDLFLSQSIQKSKCGSLHYVSVLYNDTLRQDKDSTDIGVYRLCYVPVRIHIFCYHDDQVLMPDYHVDNPFLSSMLMTEPKGISEDMMLVDAASIDSLIDISVPDEHFYNKTHIIVYNAGSSLIKSDSLIALITINTDATDKSYDDYSFSTSMPNNNVSLKHEQNQNDSIARQFTSKHSYDSSELHMYLRKSSRSSPGNVLVLSSLHEGIYALTLKMTDEATIADSTFEIELEPFAKKEQSIFIIVHFQRHLFQGNEKPKQYEDNDENTIMITTNEGRVSTRYNGIQTGRNLNISIDENNYINDTIYQFEYPIRLIGGDYTCCELINGKKLIAKIRFDRELKDQYNLNIESKVGNKILHSNLIILVNDKNDNSPQLTQNQRYIGRKSSFFSPCGHAFLFYDKCQTQQHSKSFSAQPLIRIPAIDADKGENGRIEFRLKSNPKASIYKLKQSTGEIFSIDKNSGWMFVRSLHHDKSKAIIASTNGCYNNSRTIRLVMKDSGNLTQHTTECRLAINSVTKNHVRYLLPMMIIADSVGNNIYVDLYINGSKVITTLMMHQRVHKEHGSRLINTQELNSILARFDLQLNVSREITRKVPSKYCIDCTMCSLSWQFEPLRVKENIKSASFETWLLMSLAIENNNASNDDILQRRHICVFEISNILLNSSKALIITVNILNDHGNIISRYSSGTGKKSHFNFLPSKLQLDLAKYTHVSINDHAYGNNSSAIMKKAFVFVSLLSSVVTLLVIVVVIILIVIIRWKLKIKQSRDFNEIYGDNSLSPGSGRAIPVNLSNVQQIHVFDCVEMAHQHTGKINDHDNQNNNKTKYQVGNLVSNEKGDYQLNDYQDYFAYLDNAHRRIKNKCTQVRSAQKMIYMNCYFKLLESEMNTPIILAIHVHRVAATDSKRLMTVNESRGPTFVHRLCRRN
ncbi:hypothetical protein GJ496_000087 [Pomphorhynchus laevis]|nr:hypothetical protein GJ496_000087 [Pomphorhynchus laevis]